MGKCVWDGLIEIFLVRSVEGLNADIVVCSVMDLRYGVFGDVGLDRTESFLDVNHGQAPFGVKEAVQFFLKMDSICLDFGQR